MDNKQKQNIMVRVETEEFGKVELRVAMFDIDGTNLVEGIEIKSLEDEFDLIRIHAYHNIYALSVDEIEDLITQNY